MRRDDSARSGVPEDSPLERGPFSSLCGTQCPLWARETIVPGGRTDIVVSFGNASLGEVAVLLIELKKGVATDDNQLERLRRWFEGQAGTRLGPVVISQENDGQRGGFFLRSWSGVCQRLRREAATSTATPQIVTALALAFVGAVEQNILHMSHGLVSAVRRSSKIILPLGQREQALSHLEEWLRLLDGGFR
jgi:hypothetical protein